MAEQITRGEILMAFAAENQGSLVRQQGMLELFAKTKKDFAPADDAQREKIESAYGEIVGYIPATESEIPRKLEAANILKVELFGDLTNTNKTNDYLLTDLGPGLDDLRGKKTDTDAAKEVLEFGRALIGLKLSAIKEANEWMGRGGPPTMEAQRAMDFRQWREKFGEPVRWVGRDGEKELALKICNVLLTTGVDAGDIAGFLGLIDAKKSQYGHMGDFASAIKNLSGTDKEPGAMGRILEVGSRSNVSIEGLRGAISSLTPGDIVALANLTWSFKIQGENRSLSVGQVLEKLLTLPGGMRAWTDPYWSGTREGGVEALFNWMDSDDADNPFRGAETGMELDPGFNVYPDTEPRKAGVMDKGYTNVEDIPEDIREQVLKIALIDGSPLLTLYLAARALGVLTQPTQRLYGARGIMEALPGIQKMLGALYDVYYTNQGPFYRKRGFIALMGMIDRAVRSPLDTIKPLSNTEQTMDGFAFLELRDQEVARGGVQIDKAAVERDLKAEFRLNNGRDLEGQELKEALNYKLNKIDVLLLNVFGCPVDDPGSFEQEFAVARIVGAMNDSLISPTCEEIPNPITDVERRREIALEKARNYFRYQVDLAMSYTDRRAHSINPLVTYVKYVHVPPEMSRHKLELMEEEYQELLGYVDFAGLLKRWKGIPETDAGTHFGLDAAISAVDAMGAGVMATLPGGTKDLNTPFGEKQGGYWEAERSLYDKFSQAYQLSLQVLDDDAERKVGMKIGNENELNEAAYHLVRNVFAAIRGVGANEQIRSGAMEQYFKWIEDTAPNTTFIGGKPPVVTFFHLAAMVCADLVGKAFVPPYIDRDKRSYLVDNRKIRRHAPLGVNDDPAEYGDFYTELPDDILALVNVDKDPTGKALMSPGRMTSFSAIGLDVREGEEYARESEMQINTAKYAGSKKIMFGNSEKAYGLMLQATFNKLCDLGLVDAGERKQVMSGLTVLPDLKKAFELE